MCKYLLIVIIVLGTTTVRGEMQEAEYGKWEPYSVEYVLKYSDFDLYFKGVIPGALYPGQTKRRMGDEYSFLARSENEEVHVIWSAGTGDIGPVFFTLNKRKYVLEIKMSDILSERAPKNTVAIWLESEWYSKKQRSWFWRLLW
jgi:hypothetical protein